MDSMQRQYYRRLTRLKGYDYSQPGGYFVTICTKDRKCLFGEIDNDRMLLNYYGEAVRQSWLELPNHYHNVVFDVFEIMPNHIHGIIFIKEVGAGLKPAPTGHALPEIIRAFKTFSSRNVNKLRQMPGISLWQRSYYEHVIRKDESLDRIRDYIVTNPLRWSLDRENPAFQT